MNTPDLYRSRAGALLAFAAHLLSASVVLAQSSAPAPDPKEEEEEIVVLSPFTIGSLGLTPGGFQDINYARDLLKLGMLPLPEEFTAEGLFSEYDLPVAGGRPTKLVEVNGAAMPASIVAQPDVTHLVQIGFSSTLTPENFKRDPLFLTIVLDVSGSMEPYFGLLKESVLALIGSLREGDAVSIVTFSDSAQVVQTPVLYSSTGRSELRSKVNAIEIQGGTNIAMGLRRGFGLAKVKPAGFSGRSRVVLVTDAMPNIDETAPQEFMALAVDASLNGVGLTTIGLNIQFDADFVRKVSSVSGGNAYWFANAEQMKSTLERDFDFMMTEVAFDFELRVKPAPGFRVAKVYGVPGDTYAITEEGGMLMDVPTLFLSRNRGAIFIAMTSNRPDAGISAAIGNAALSYTVYGSREVINDGFELRVSDARGAPSGLRRGRVLISEYEALQAAGRAFYKDNRIRDARTLVRTALEQFRGLSDSELSRERDLLTGVEAFLAAAESDPPITEKLYRSRKRVAPLVGVWREDDEEEAVRWVFLPSGKAVTISQEGEHTSFSQTKWNRSGVGEKDERMKFGVDKDGLYLSQSDTTIRLQRVVDRQQSDSPSQ